MIDLTNFDEYVSYFSGLAASHTDVSSFFIGEMEHFQNEIKSNLQPRVLWLEPYQPVTVQDAISDNHLGQVNCSMVVYGVAESEAFADSRTEYKNCEAVVKDIMSRMLKDYNEGIIMLRSLQGWTYGQAEDIVGSTRLVGCRFDWNYMRPERLAYNVAKWQ